MDSYNFLPDNEVTEVEGRKYLNPNLVVDETNTFIDRLRNTQQANMQQTATQTQRLGTDVPSNLGGLTGAGSYWSSRYVTPQTSSAVSNLRAAAQAQALNQALANEQERWKQKYSNAYRAQQKSAYNKANSSVTSGGVNQTDPTQTVKHSWEFGTEPVTYDQDIGTSAGWGELSDLWTHEYNFTLPGGTQLNLGGWDEELKLGSDGNYYIWNRKDNTYTPINLGGEGSTSGGSKWWQR